ncbi:DUF4190 domain-containing protein [Kribbella sp. CA-293567]|uniref:DUF4190 domain-containing protein n=1 Tax=Kribbella sp. CA-293567 TaxID=3002436 RepID=UPI0022DCF1A5|nr:DUF4190 domain-containing protein [Kribbella sp. CA-293567]WBQ07185.1 DUF4190 domain-containing protein [Kribbella sp. CA-293567]
MSFDGRPQDRPQGPAPTQYELQPGYVYPQPAYGVRRDNSNATLAMVLGLLGLGTMFIVLSPIAWWKGNQALAEIDAMPGVYSNRGMAVAGQITGIIGTVLLGLGVLFVAGLLLFAIVATSN